MRTLSEFDLETASQYQSFAGGPSSQLFALSHFFHQISTRATNKQYDVPVDSAGVLRAMGVEADILRASQAASVPPSTAAAPATPASQPTSTPETRAPARRGQPAPAARVPTPKAASKAAPLSYATAAKSGLSTVMSQLAVAFPQEPPAGLIQMAEKLIPKPPANKPHVRHAPRHSSRHVDVSFKADTAPHAESVPLDGLLYRDLLDHLGNSMVEHQSRLLSVTWNHRGRFRLTFNGVVPAALDNSISHYFGTKFARDRSPSSVLIERFSFRNQVVFRRVPTQGATSETLFRELCSDPVWSGVTLARPPNLYIPKTSAKYGMFFVEFNDNSTSRTFKRVMSTPIYLNGELCHAAKVLDSKPPSPQCAVCLRWGHRTHLCRAVTKRCWKCGGTHDERDHVKTCGPCERSGNTTGICPCEPFCINCQGSHRADSKDCSFYTHRRDPEWIREHMPRAPPGVNASTWVPTREGKKGKGKKARRREGEVGADVMEE